MIRSKAMGAQAPMCYSHLSRLRFQDAGWLQMPSQDSNPYCRRRQAGHGLRLGSRVRVPDLGWGAGRSMGQMQWRSGGKIGDVSSRTSSIIRKLAGGVHVVPAKALPFDRVFLRPIPATAAIALRSNRLSGGPDGDAEAVRQ